MGDFRYSISDRAYKFVDGNKILDQDRDLEALAKRSGIWEITPEEVVEFARELEGKALMLKLTNVKSGQVGDLYLYESGDIVNRWLGVFYSKAKVLDKLNLRIDLTTSFSNAFYLKYSKIRGELTAEYHDGRPSQQALWVFPDGIIGKRISG